MRLNEADWIAVERYLRVDDRLILPIGSTEQHGPHLPIGTDLMIADAIACRASDRIGVMVMPAIPYGMSVHHAAFPGTLSLSPGLLTDLLEEILRSLFAQGFKRTLILNAHGGNNTPIKQALMTICNDLSEYRVKFINWQGAPEVRRIIRSVFGTKQGLHATPGESSVMLHLFPERVDMARAVEDLSQHSDDLFYPKEIREVFPTGVMGADPRLASADVGGQLFEAAVSHVVESLNSWRTGKGDGTPFEERV